MLASTACVVKGNSTSTSATGKSQGGSSQTGGTPQAGPLPGFVMLLTDLGLGDGTFVREADTALSSLAKQGKLTYSPVGQIPKPLTEEAGGEDVGLPVPQGKGPGEMTLVEATGLLTQAPEVGVLVVSAGYLLPSVMEAASKGQVKAKAILLLDEQGMGTLPPAPAVPVFRIRYDARPIAYVAGVAAGESANSAQFGVLYAADDPQGLAFAKAIAAGAKYQNNGAWTETIAVPVGSDGYVTPAAFTQAFAALHSQAGSGWKPNHFILDLGRSTPTIMNAISKKPTNAYVVGAYGDYRQVRPARVVGCVLKLPGVALTKLISRLDPAMLASDPAAALQQVCDADGVFQVGMEDNAVGFTSFDMYKRYNMDGADIEASVESVLGQIRAGELQLEY